MAKDYKPNKKSLIGDKTMNDETMRVNHPEDHPDVQKIADKKYDKMKKKIFGGVGMLGDSIKKSRKMDAKATKESKRFMDTVQTIKSKKMSASEGSFSKGGRAGYKHGGSPQGYGAARTSGMGLQDEELKPGKVYKAKRGSGLDLPVINSVKPTVNKTKRAQNLSEMKIQFTKQKNRTGINSGTLDKILSKTKNPYSDLKATTAKGPTQYSSMDEMRQANHGFKPGESNTAFLKRRMDLRAATKAVSATKIGK